MRTITSVDELNSELASIRGRLDHITRYERFMGVIRLAVSFLALFAIGYTCAALLGW